VAELLIDVSIEFLVVFAVGKSDVLFKGVGLRDDQLGITGHVLFSFSWEVSILDLLDDDLELKNQSLKNSLRFGIVVVSTPVDLLEFFRVVRR